MSEQIWKSWKLEDEQHETSGYWGCSPEWINADFNPMGIREIVYCGDRYMSAHFCCAHDTWEEDINSQPTFVCTSFPVAPPFITKEV